MSLIVGGDSYISVADADRYVQNNYAHRADITTKWDLLTTAEKESMLRSSTSAIDHGFKFRGRKVKTAQHLQFPRYNTNFLNWCFGANEPSAIMDTTLMEDANRNDSSAIRRSNKMDTQMGGFAEAAQATVENAIAGMLYGETSQQVQKNSILGLTSQKLGSVSETYSTAQNMNSRAAQYGIYAYEKVTHLLISWVSGNFLSI